MDALIPLFGALAAGLLLGRAARAAGWTWSSPLAARALGWLVPPLVAVQGVIIGADPGVVARLPVVGLQAAALALATLLASALLALGLGRRLAARVGWPAEPAPGAPHPLRAVVLVSGALAAGIGIGAAGLWPAAIDAGAGSWWLLLALVFLVGVETGAEGRSLLYQVRRFPALLLLPAAVVGGSLVMGLVAMPFLGRAGLAGAAGCGWYSLAGPLVTDVLGPEPGALAFLANLLREVFALILIPVLVRYAGAGPAVAAAGATAMDTALPFLARAGGSGVVLPALVSGGIVSAAVPWLVGLVLGA